MRRKFNYIYTKLFILINGFYINLIEMRMKIEGNVI